MKKFSSKRALLLSVLSMVICVSMLIGSTFAWFTDSATANVNTIKSGDLDVEIVKADGSELTSALKWVAKDGRAQDKILWEPGCEYNLESFKIKNAGDLALKYKVVISGLTGDATLLEAIDFTVKAGDAAPVSLEGWDGKLLPAGAEKTEITQDADIGETALITITGTMKTTAGNDYRGLSLEGISITVYATQLAHEFDSNGNTYDDDAGKDTAYYTLSEFNALTEIPEGIKNVYVDLGGVSLQNGITIGNENIADHYHYGEWNSETAPEGYPHKTNIDNITTHDGDKVRYIYSTGKSSVNVILTGFVQGANDTGNFNAGTITLKVPDAANVVFDKVTFGAGQMSMSMWTESHVQSMTVGHRVASVTFDGCTFNGNWIQNGAFGADELVIKNAVFNLYENKAYKNNSNPIWIQNLGKTNVTIEGCTFNAVRPIKLWEGTASGTVTIKNNTFNMSNFADATGSDVYKNVAVMFCQSTLENVEISGNTVTGEATGFICFYDDSTHYPTMADGATFTIGENTLNGVKESVIWKTTTEWKPSYVVSK